MPHVFRVISNRRRWDKPTPELFPWLRAGEIQADAVTDLRTQKNGLSVFIIDNDRNNLDRVVAAFAANRDDYDKLDYVLFEDRVLDELEIRTQQQPGITPDPQVNRWHINLVELSAQKVVDLARAILRYGTTSRVLKKTVQKMIEDGVLEGRIDRARLRNKILARIE